jgi:hypothetical protein
VVLVTEEELQIAVNHLYRQIVLDQAKLKGSKNARASQVIFRRTPPLND